MAAAARSLDESARQFRDQLSTLLSTTLTQSHVQCVRLRPDLVSVRLTSNKGPGATILSRRFGKRIVLALGQHLTSDVTDAGERVLRTVKYTYAIALPDANDSIIRWDYEKTPDGSEATHCRHHVQGIAMLSVDGKEPFRMDDGSPLLFDDFHTPTGYVAIEEIIRFCIVDLGVKPLHEDWDRTLKDSLAEFRAKDRCPFWPQCDRIAGLGRTAAVAETDAKRDKRRRG